MGGAYTPGPPIEQFIAAAQAVGARVEWISPGNLDERIRALDDSGAHSARVATAQGSGTRPSLAAARGTHVSRALAGVSRTGTVVVAERSEANRVSQFLASRHVVVLDERSLVPDLPEIAGVLRRCIREGRPHVTFVTGPSRTSDIEKVLTIGVHGPGELVILVVRGTGTDED